MENSMKKRTTSSETVIDDRCFIIESYDPMLGNYILMQVLTMVLPMGLGSMINDEVPGSEKVMNKAENKKMMSKKEFIEFQKDILSNVYEKYSTGQKSPVVMPNGEYGVANLTMKICIRLIISSLAFNFSDFFEDGELGNFLTLQ